MSSRHHQALYGCNEPLPQRTPLRCGPLTLERVGGRFGPIHADGHEVWHGAAFLFRDAGWGTPEPVFDDVRLHSQGQAFELELLGYIPCAASDVAGEPAHDARILLRLQVQGNAAGELCWHAQATPTHDLLANRCGWVLMHPMSVAGGAVEIEHVDGRISQSTWPVEVAAWPPFIGVRGVRHAYAPGQWAEAVLSDEDYELEDQRNNADASFKTYSRSNLMPRPYLLRRGQSLNRRMHLRLLETCTPPAVSIRAGWTQPTLSESPPRAMALGMSITPEMAHSPPAWLRDAVHGWRPAFLHLTLWPSMRQTDVDWAGVRRLLTWTASALRLDVCMGGDSLPQDQQEASVQELADQLLLTGITPTRIAALPCGPRIASLLRKIFPGAVIGGGTPHFFAQLNRLEVSGGEDFMTFTVCPIVHGTDDEGVMDGLRSLSSMIATARRRHPGRQWHLGPSALSARASPLGPQPITDGQKRIALARKDPRTQGLFGAAWLVGHLAAAAQAGIQSVTTPPLLGEDGLMGLSCGTRRATPSAAVLDVCLRWPSLQTVSPSLSHRLSSNPELAAIAGQGQQGHQVLLANLSAHSQHIEWPQAGQWRRLDAEAWLQHLDDPARSPWHTSGETPAELVLGPYALVCIDLDDRPGD